MSQLNLNTYNQKDVVEWYKTLGEIVPVEKYIFDMYKDQLKGKVLDIGIGGGRTSAYLLDKCGNYTGIDYSKEFTAITKAKFPAADIRHMDARDLSAFDNEMFDLVNFSFNGIDYVEPEGRVKVLKEINRVLKPGGVFFFSTHNKSHSSFNKSAWSNPENGLWTNIKTFIKLLPYFFVHSKQKRHEIFHDDFAIINDSAHNYSLLTFYTTPGYLRRQLSAGGYDSCSFYSKDGEIKIDNDLDDWIFVTCKKLLS